MLLSLDQSVSGGPVAALVSNANGARSGGKNVQERSAFHRATEV
ncbi:hypothetical protein [Mycolicibacterium conceptionense]|nr:hypothetical protein [Mycolicibacterium conceptionense]